MAEAYAETVPSQDEGTDKEAPKADNKALVRSWWREIQRYGRAYEKWHERGEKIVKRYLDEDRDQEKGQGRRMALFWANIETLKPAIYAKVPQVVVSRRYRDPDPTGRVACEVLERSTNTTFDLYSVDEVLRMVRDDRLLVARGQAWVRMEAQTTKASTSKGEQYDKLAYQKVCCDYVHWCDFGHNVARTWADVWVVWRKVYKAREDVTKRWGKKVASGLKYNHRDPLDTAEEAEDKACIYEVWDKRANKTGWIVKADTDKKSQAGELEVGEPPLNLRRFFPCPEPCYGTKTSRSLQPRPDMIFYQDQLNEIDDLTEKIGALQEWLVLKAFIPAGPSGDGGDAVKAMLDLVQTVHDRYGQKGLFVPVESWASFAEKGGSKMIDWLPLDMVANALKVCIEVRNQLIQDVYQITGISDILRGQTDPDETLGAQEIKAQAGSRRVKNAKDEMARFSKDLANIVAEVIAEYFTPETLSAMTGMKYIPAAPQPASIQPNMMGQQAPMPYGGMGLQQPQQPSPLGMGAVQGQPPPQMDSAAAGAPSQQHFDEKVLQLLRDDRMRGFLIDIETDSTVQPDEDAEKRRRTEFVTAVGTLLKEAVPVLQVMPQMAPMIGATMKFVVRGFRAGKELEDIIERTMDQVTQMLSQPQQPQEDPEMVKAKTQMAVAKQKAELDQQKAVADVQIKRESAQADIQIAREKAQSDIAISQHKMVQEAQLAEQEQAMDFRQRQQQMQHDMMAAHADRQMQREGADQDRQLQAHNATQDRKLAAKNAAADRAAQKLNGTQTPGRR